MNNEGELSSSGFVALVRVSSRIDFNKDLQVTAQHQEFLDKCEAMKARGVLPETVDAFIHDMEHVQISDHPRLSTIITNTLEHVSGSSISTIPSLCLGPFTRAIQLLGLGDLPLAVRRQTQTGYFTAIASFLTSHKSDDCMQSLQEKWQRCQCDMTDPLVYKCHLFSEKRFHDIWMGPVEFMVIELHRITNYIKFGKPEPQEGWPNSPADVLHGDPAEAVAAAVQWLRHTTIPSVIFENLVAFCLFIPSFPHALRTNKDILEASTVHFDHMVLRLEDPDAKENTSYIDTSLMVLVPQVGGVLSCIDFFQEIIRPTKEMTVTLVAVAQRIYDICLRLLHTNAILSESLEHAIIKLIGRGFYDYIPTATRPKNLDPSMMSVYAWIQKSLVRLTNVKRCMNPGCENKGTLQQCSRCRLMLYCGAECQRKAWKLENTPHNRLCKVLQPFALLLSVDGSMGGRDNFEDWATTYGLKWKQAEILKKMLRTLEEALGIDDSETESMVRAAATSS
ncbi:hypothetical protein C8J56DRAFT_959717 [Mycena floridula]|nr:hypothetical protein C8J56DRAFT_959717 [Mycena floridula]